jgi:tRNA (guanine-N7-)-methyltransferase
VLLEDCNDVYASNPSESLKIKTHYEALDIAGSNKIFYLKFQLPAVIKDLDEELQFLLKETENQ